MAASAQVSVTTTAGKVSTAAGAPRQVWVRVTATGTVYLGGLGVTSAQGFAVADTDGFVGPITLGSNEDLYAITASGTATAQVLTATANS